MVLFDELNNLMIKYHFKPSHKLSQYFIIDEKLIEEMISCAELKKTDSVLEIGSGTGFLTREIQKKCSAIAFELDKNLFELLSNELPKKNIALFNENFLKAEKIPAFNKVVCAPPYHISSELMHKLLFKKFDRAVLLFQKEFCEKLVSEPGFKEYCALSVLTQYFCEPKISLYNVSPTAFYPKPNIFSSIIVLDSKKRFGGVKNEKLFEDFLKQIFRYRNKNLSNALQKSFGFLKKDLKVDQKAFNEKALSLELAREKISLIEPKEFVQIFNEII